MKKLLSYFITSIFIASTFISPTASALKIIPTSSQGEGVFSDVNEKTPNNDAIEYLKENKHINGYSDGTYKPGNTINRAEFITIIMNSIADNFTETDCFPDVNGEWFAGPACEAKKRGFIDGYDNGHFEGHRNINLAEAGKIISNAYKLELGQGSNWFEPFIKALENRKAIPVSIDSLDKKLSRAEVAEMIYRIKDQKEAKASKTLDSLNQHIPHISSCIELQEKIATHQYKNNYYYLTEDSEGDFPTSSPERSGAGEGKASQSTSKLFSKDAVSEEYSTTNIQVENVDESDRVKNNGSHIFSIDGKEVKIIKAYPASQMEQVSKIEPDSNFTPSSVYLNGKQLIILGSSYNNKNYKSQTTIYIYNVSNPANPFQERLLRFDGNEISSRRIGDNLYLVLRNYQPYYHYNHNDSFSFGKLTELRNSLPSFYDSAEAKTSLIADCNQISYFPGHRNIDYLVVAGISLDGKNKSVHRSMMLGGSQNIYASTEHLYVANTEYNYDHFEIYDSWDDDFSESTENSVIYQFELDDGEVKFKDKGKVPGRILNQFSMDEYKNSFRIATTSNSWSSSNNLYVLDKNNLNNITGRIENIAPGEQIYSVRFMGDKTYMVTFKTTDPFFVIDTSNAYNPKILGKLKIPGYSNYLHPYDENHIIGIGKEAVADKNGDFAWYQGMKIALYNVKDVENPREVSNITIGSRGTESEVLNNHRALLFSKEKGFLALPILEAHLPEYLVAPKNSSPSNYGEYTFQGAHVYNIDTNKGLSLRGKITHHSGDDFLKSGSYWYGSNSDINRILYIGDNFYTLSNNGLKATNMISMETKNSIKLSPNNSKYDEDYYEDVEPIGIPFLDTLFD